MGCGKVFHASGGQKRSLVTVPLEVKAHCRTAGFPLPQKPLEASSDRGTFPPEEAQYHDVINNSQWAAEQLLKDHEAPLFLTVGLYRPYFYLSCPKRFIDLHPLEDVLLPTVLKDDMEDIPQGGRSIAHNPLASCTRVVLGEESLERGRAGVFGFGEFCGCMCGTFDEISG